MKQILIGLLFCSFIVTGCVGKVFKKHEIISSKASRDYPDFIQSGKSEPIIPGFRLPPHPYMAKGVSNSMHADGYASETYNVSGPVGPNPNVYSRKLGVLAGQCPTVNFLEDGHAVPQCFKVNDPFLHLIDTKTNDTLDAYYKNLPRRGARVKFALRKIQSNTSGVYFYVDHNSHIVLADSQSTIHVIGTQKDDNGFLEFNPIRTYELKKTINAYTRGDYIIAVLPDWENRIWFITKHGLVGWLDRKSGSTKIDDDLLNNGEIFQNSFSVAEDGVYVVSDKALYRYGVWQLGPFASRPYKVWREPYERGTIKKLGMLELGSGTTPSIMGERYIAIADNSDPINVLVFDRKKLRGNRLVCKVPVFPKGKSATENSLIVYNNSIIIKNDFGHSGLLGMRGGKTAEPGVVRIDVLGKNNCPVIWSSNHIAQTVVPKLSIGSGLIYVVTKKPNLDEDVFYFTAISFHDGTTVFERELGVGIQFDPNWSAISLGPDGAAYVGVLDGYVQIKDVKPEKTALQVTDTTATNF